MRLVALMNQAARCGARTRAGTPCRQAVVNGKDRCRMHGGARGSGGQIGNKNALKHGLYSAETVEERQYYRQLIRTCREMVEKA